jgi:hypothetical protein
MNKQNLILSVLTLSLIGGTAGLLAHLRTNQRLGLPGVKTSPLANSRNLKVELPELVLDYTSQDSEVDKIVLGTLPADTSFGQRSYTAPDNFWIQLNVVLMGADRTSLHKPQFCLEGQGFHIDQGASAETSVRMEKPEAYDLPVVKLIANRQTMINGQPTALKAVYVYYYVADGAISASALGFQRMWWMARDLVRTGVLQRWAYVSYFAVCMPGQEDATFERMKKFISASVPEFQLGPTPVDTRVSAR